MIRRIQMSINDSNGVKLRQLDRLMFESLRVMNLYVDELWESSERFNKFTSVVVETWLSKRMQQCLLKQAVEVMKSQRKKKKQTKPVINRRSLNLDERFVRFEQDVNSFDFWIRLGSLGERIILDLPSRKHKHFNDYVRKGWVIRKGCRLRNVGDKWFIDVYMEKDRVELREQRKELGVDVGYKKLIVCSDGQVSDVGLQGVYEKISRKVQGSKGFKRALTERDQKINASVNRVDLGDVRLVVVENLKQVKHGKRGKIRKSFMNKLQRWSYPKVLDKLERLCEESGIAFLKVNPAYTSQTCSVCGSVDKRSRDGEVFCCTGCGVLIDADYNASVNILRRGVYSPSSV